MPQPGRCRRLAAAALLGAALIGSAIAQTDPAGHAGHHPDQPSPAPPMLPAPPSGGALGAAPPTSGAVSAGAGCVGMMGCMGAAPRPFYASLLDMPTLTPEARRFIEAEAQWRIGWGSQAIGAGHARLNQALSANDLATLDETLAGIRQGLLRLESGASALRAVEAGAPPNQLALAWFRDQLGTAPPEGTTMAMGDGPWGLSPWGLSWYHLTSMAFLIAFLIGALLIQLARMRRIDGLVERLTPRDAPGSAPKAGMAPPAAPTAGDSGNASAAPPKLATKQPWSGMLRVAAIFRETGNVKTFRLMNPEGGDIPFTFLAGQFLTFSAEIRGNPLRRSYTIASSACQRSYVEVAVKREELGAESRYLHDQVAVGDSLQVSGPSGSFTFTGEEADSIVLISGGIGITPMMCVVRCLNDRSYRGDIFFLYGARTVDDFIFREELEYLQKRHANLHVKATMGQASDSPWLGARGPITKGFIAQAVPDIARRRVHICGPPAMMEAVKTTLLELGVAKEKIKTEAFGAAQGRAPPDGRAAAVPVAAQDPGAAPPTTEVAAAPTAGAPTACAQVEFTISGKTAPLAPDQSVLEAAEAIGVEIDYACRVGTCGICVVPLKSGAVSMAIEDGLPPEDKAKGLILACQAKSVGNLVVEA